MSESAATPRPRTRKPSPGRTGPTTRKPESLQSRKSASTRRQILDAAIECIVKHGYANTTTLIIAKTAEVSRGAMLHHFPSKIDVINAAVEHLYNKRQKAFYKAIDALPPDNGQIRPAIEAYLKHVMHPLYVAFFELKVASRTDKDLYAVFEPARKKFDTEWDLMARKLFPNWEGDQKAFELALDLTHYLLEGMAINSAAEIKSDRAQRLLDHLEKTIRELRPGKKQNNQS
ncbi:TetR/AcrR family transcriptional regulator [Emcibacter sp.]|uniref:TetR/AcrR family transcriptional regulator n=1 Tax=Emcibacter sp. TaxID=1979954 RepID=UPI002AA60F47|nr:TetR/AcrR family transcriptional regulator [Emcibacter sp.]